MCGPGGDILFYKAHDRLRTDTTWTRRAALLLIATGFGCLPCAAFAQTDTPPFAQPLIGQVQANTALSTVAAGNADRLTVSPSFNMVFDSNVLRRAQPDGVDTGNFRFTPGISLVLRRSLGRVAINVAGTAGYDFNSRYRFLNKERIDFSGGIRAPVGAICSANLTASYDQYQFDLGDVTLTQSSITRNQTYDLALSCNRSAGFSPVAGATYRTLSSSGSSLFDYTQVSERAGIAYAQPSLGTLTLTGTLSQLRRPNIIDVLGINDDTNIRTLTLALDRAVSQRVQLSVGVGYTHASPARGGVSAFSGLSYNGRVNWNITPRIVMTGSAVRQVTNENGISATYVIRDDYQASASWQFSRASQVQLAAFRSHRDFRGESLTPTLIAIREDRTNGVSGNYHYDTARWLRLGLGVSHQWRTADNALYNYQSTIVSGSIGTRF